MPLDSTPLEVTDFVLKTKVIPKTRKQRFEEATKLWQILEVALEDYYEILKNAKYVIDMGKWHSPLASKCFVCFAGCVMVNTLGENRYTLVIPESFSYSISQKLHVLNVLRMGHIVNAYHMFYGNYLQYAKWPGMVRVSNPVTPLQYKHFGDDMYSLLSWLKEKDL
jgi:hypothetical protein